MGQAAGVGENTGLYWGRQDWISYFVRVGGGGVGWGLNLEVYSIASGRCEAPEIAKGVRGCHLFCPKNET